MMHRLYKAKREVNAEPDVEQMWMLHSLIVGSLLAEIVLAPFITEILSLVTLYERIIAISLLTATLGIQLWSLYSVITSSVALFPSLRSRQRYPSTRSSPTSDFVDRQC